MKILVGILFGPLALFVFIELTRPSMSSGTVGERQTVLLFSGPRYERFLESFLDFYESFLALTMFNFSGILVKKLSKWLEICLAFDYQLGHWK